MAAHLLHLPFEVRCVIYSYLVDTESCVILVRIVPESVQRPSFAKVGPACYSAALIRRNNPPFPRLGGMLQPFASMPLPAELAAIDNSTPLQIDGALFCCKKIHGELLEIVHNAVSVHLCDRLAVYAPRLEWMLPQLTALHRQRITRLELAKGWSERRLLEQQHWIVAHLPALRVLCFTLRESLLPIIDIAPRRYGEKHIDKMREVTETLDSVQGQLQIREFIEQLRQNYQELCFVNGSSELVTIELLLGLGEFGTELYENTEEIRDIWRTCPYDTDVGLVMHLHESVLVRNPSSGRHPCTNLGFSRRGYSQNEMVYSRHRSNYRETLYTLWLH
jgi:hypothetical protein